MKAILMSIKPQHTCNILNDIKWWEIRKKFPKDYVGWVYIYCTKKYDECLWYKNDSKCYVLNYGKPTNDYLNGKVVARFWCDNVTEYINGGRWNSDNTFGSYDDYIKDKILEQSCLTEEELFAYCEDLSFKAIHITKLEIFDKPKEISEFAKQEFDSFISGQVEHYKYPLTRAPQSYCFIEV